MATESDIESCLPAICEELHARRFTGADVQAIVSSANLAAINRWVSADDAIRAAAGAPRVTKEDLRQASLSTRSSIPEEEWEFYHCIYKKFHDSSREAEFVVASATAEAGKQRVTLK
jgi:SpoVK/Ycf46/Vps4 family AAA+-type ATPase